MINFVRTTEPAYLVIYFQVHQPLRLQPFSFFDIGTGKPYFDDDGNREIMRRVALLSYRPANLTLLRLIRKYPQVRIAFSISGVALEQMERFAPAVIDDFRLLAETGSVEFLSETYFHSLSCLISAHEFTTQVQMHREKIYELFGKSPSVFRNTELIYWDAIGELIADFGFTGVIADGHEKILGKKSPNRLYQHPDLKDIRLMFRNYRLSDDIAFRFAQQDWPHYPLSATKFISWLEAIPEKENLVTLSMDYETFGEHQKAGTGIFRFLEELFTGLSQSRKRIMVTPSEATSLIENPKAMSVSSPSSWADQDRDLSAWLGNEMQNDSFETLRDLEQPINEAGNEQQKTIWRNLQTSDHFYYMSTKQGDDGNVHNYFSPYGSPYDAFMNYMNVLNDFALSLETKMPVMSN